jgi:sulfhydrogenase subunit beta (sulfur reductase)
VTGAARGSIGHSYRLRVARGLRPDLAICYDPFPAMANDTHVSMPVAGIERLIEILRADGFTVVGPRVRDGAIVYDEIDALGDLPVGWTDVQEAASYRLERRADAALFGYNVGPHSWRRFLDPARQRLFRAERTEDGFRVLEETAPPPRYAFLGVRSCELHALRIQDRVFIEGRHSDPGYEARRRGSFLVAVNCGQAGGTCFCVSMATGPKATAGFDLALTEIVAPSAHRFLIETGSPAGEAVLARLPVEPSTQADETAAAAATARAAASMGRRMDTANIKELLYGNLEHPRWQEVAERCLTCANCTLVCPTCFCSTVEDVTDLTGDHAERWRRWDSCFTMDFSYIHGGSVRASGASRYRQWLTHKLATWIDQFGTSGCVGCGRCITWCPVGIDLTEEVRAIRETTPRSSHTEAT